MLDYWTFKRMLHTTSHSVKNHCIFFWYNLIWIWQGIYYVLVTVHHIAVLSYVWGLKVKDISENTTFQITESVGQHFLCDWIESESIVCLCMSSTKDTQLREIIYYICVFCSFFFLHDFWNVVFCEMLLCFDPHSHHEFNVQIFYIKRVNMLAHASTGSPLHLPCLSTASSQRC